MNTAGTSEKLTNYSNKTLSIKAAKALLGLGVPPGMKGYYFLLSSIMIAYNEPDVTEFVTKDLYRRVAREYGTEPSSVERASRYIIGRTYKTGSAEMLHNYFGSSRKPPSGGEFIREISARLRSGEL